MQLQRFAYLLVATFFLSAGSGGSAVAQDCQQVGQLASFGDQPAQLTLQNVGQQSVYVFWINYQGAETDYQNQNQPLFQLGPGQSSTFDALQGHYYSVYSEDEYCVSVIGVTGQYVEASVGGGGGSYASGGEQPVDNQYGGDNGYGSASQPAAQPTYEQPQTQPAAGGGSDIQTVLNLVNRYRANGATCSGTGRSFGPAPALQLHAGLSQAAQNWSSQMLNTGQFTHGDSASRIIAVCGQTATGENIAGNGTAQGAVQGWMASTSGHCENIMNPDYRVIGIGKAAGGQYGAYWTQKFASNC